MCELQQRVRELERLIVQHHSADYSRQLPGETCEPCRRAGEA